jgi:hypothetical protein
LDKGLKININILFGFISVGLAMIFFIFKPLDIKEQSFNDVPLFEVNLFTIYEINTFGLDSILVGTKGTRYTNRYDIDNVNFTDNTKKYIANVKANNGVYKDDIITLKHDVVYNREDGISFSSDEAVYNKKNSIVKTNYKYIAYNGKNKLIGSSLVYDNVKNRTKSKNITVIYQLREKK